MPLTRFPPVRQDDPETRIVSCEYGPLATRRKRLAAVCRCVGWTFAPWTDPRLRKLLEVARGHADCGGSLAPVLAALHSADEAGAEAVQFASRDVWTLAEGQRVGDAATTAHLAQTVTSGVRWALGMGGLFPPIPAGWAWLRAALAACENAPAFEPMWRTTDVLALAKTAQTGATEVLPILADALQEAGCNDAQILTHCRDNHPHVPRCWVPDLILDAE